jgi:hypothetical protein
MRYAAHPTFMSIESAEDRLLKITVALKKLFLIVFPFTIIILLTAVVMIMGYDLKSTPFSSLGHAKEAIWIVMFVNYILMIKRRNRAVDFLANGDIVGAKVAMSLVGKYMIPLNIIIGVIAIFLGTTLSTNL